MRPVYVFLIGAAAGFGVHELYRAPMLAARAATAAVAAPVTCELDWQRLHREVGAAVRESAQPLHAAQVPQGPPQPQPRTQAQEQALKDYAALIAEAEQRGTWTADDVRRSRQTAAAMAAPDRATAFSSLARAINDGRVKVEGPMPF